jgi:hypothetical protein
MIGDRAFCRVAWVFVALTALGCDGQQYVGADTVALVVSDEATGAPVLDACHFIPVLLGSRSVSRYRVDEQLAVTIDITRDEIVVSFDSADVIEPFRVESARFEGAAKASDAAPPAGYSVDLVSPCAL